MSTRLVDIHPHVISDDDVKYPKNPIGGRQSVWSRDRPVTWEKLELAMDEAGVDKAAVVQSSTTYGHDNSYLADCVDRAGGRIVGVCAETLIDDDSSDRIDFWITRRGMSGLRLFTAGSTIAQANWIDDQRARKGWDYIAEHDIPVCVQLSKPAIPQLRAILRAYPSLRVVLDHVAMSDFSSGPPYADADEAYELADHSGMYVKVTSTELTSAARSEGGAPAALADIVQHFGSERIAWGSNYPASQGTLQSLVAQLDIACQGLSSSDVENIRFRTALSLYPKLA